jgi:hypothetical protein
VLDYGESRSAPGDIERSSHRHRRSDGRKLCAELVRPAGDQLHLQKHRPRASPSEALA